MMFKETVAVYCENHMEHTTHSVGRMQSFGMLKQVVYIELEWFHSWTHDRFTEAREDTQHVTTWALEQWGDVTYFEFTSAEFTFKASARWVQEFKLPLSLRISFCMDGRVTWCYGVRVGVFV
jgi:hypothetical protein